MTICALNAQALAGAGSGTVGALVQQSPLFQPSPDMPWFVFPARLIARCSCEAGGTDFSTVRSVQFEGHSADVTISCVPSPSIVFDEPNLVLHPGLVPAMAVAGKAALIELADRHMTRAGGPVMRLG